MKRLLKKLLAVSLCAALTGGTAVSLPVFVTDSGITASAAETYGDFSYDVLDDGMVEITKYNGSGGEVTIPSKINGKSVTSIGWGSFEGCTKLTSITIPDSVASIGRSAFEGCTKLTGITIPSSVTSIGWGSFEGCTKLTGITIPSSVTSIGRSAFFGCSSLTNITIPYSVTSIGDWAFRDCNSLTSIVVDNDNKNYSSVDGILYNKNKTKLIRCPGGKKTANSIPSNVTSIGDNAFSGCNSLTSVTIPSSVTAIEDNAFSGCNSLTSITIPYSVTSIGGWAFMDCSSLTNITISSGVTSIGSRAFYGCTGLLSVTLPSSVTSIGDRTFGFYYNVGHIKVDGFVIYGKVGSAAEKYAKDNDFKFAENSLKNNSTVSAFTVTAGTSVTMTGKATGGISPYKYAYYYKKSTDSSWTKAYVTSSGSAYTKYDSVTFKPTTAGTYNVRINVKDNEGSVVSKDLKLTVKEAALTNKSTVSATTVTAGTEVTMTGKAAGGTSPYKYAYYYKKSTDSSWTKAYVTSSGSAYTKYDSMKFTPKTAGTYTVRINVKDKYGEGSVVSKDFKLTVKEAALTNNSTVSATSVTSGTEVTMTGKATGGTSPYKYAYYYKKSTDSSWTKAYVTSSGSAYTKYDSMKFTPKTAGTYDVRINVRDEYGNGKTVTKDFKLTVK